MQTRLKALFWQHLIEEGITEAIFRFLLESMLSTVVSQQTVVRGSPSSITEAFWYVAVADPTISS